MLELYIWWLKLSFESWNAKLWVYAWSYGNHVKVLRVLWEWIVDVVVVVDDVVVVVFLLKGYSHQTLAAIIWKVFSHRKDSSVERLY